MGAELFHVDGQTDTTNVIVAFGNFPNTPSNRLINLLKPTGHVINKQFNILK